MSAQEIKAVGKGRGGRRPGAGRPRGSGDARYRKVWRHVGLLPEDLRYLLLWGPEEGATESEALVEMIERCRALWPLGPSSNPQALERKQRAAAAKRAKAAG